MPLKDLNPGHAAESPRVLAACVCYLEWTARPWPEWMKLQTINLASPEAMEATTSQGAKITFSLDHFDVQLRRWRDIYNHGQEEGKANATLDISISNHLPVRWVASLFMPPAQPVCQIRIEKNV